MRQAALFDLPSPPTIPGVDLRLASVDHVVASLAPESVGLVHADPAWEYSAAGGATPRIGDHYDVLPMDAMARSIANAYDVAAKDCYLLLWCTSPHMRTWFLTEARAGFRWEYVSMGAWGKNGSETGIGYHWRGKAEYLLLYRKGRPKPRNLNLPNLHLEPVGEHSQKPATWLAELVDSFSLPGSTVLDLYAGMAPLACACRARGRRYIGAELDPERHERARGLIARADRVRP